MIRIGFDTCGKNEIVKEYIINNGIEKVYVFYPDDFPLSVEWETPTEFIEYKEIVMYKTFYPLLEKINEKSLLIFNECMRTQKRQDLTYNCAHHYCNQTPHKIIFEAFPFIDDVEDFMILLDLQDKGKYKQKNFNWDFFRQEDIKINPQHFTFSSYFVLIPDDVEQKYKEYATKLFDSLRENEDPENIPRALEVFAGKFKKPHISKNLQCVARNKRFNMSNVTTFKDAEAGGDYVFLDFPHKQLTLNDFFKRTGQRDVRFVNTGLKVDLAYAAFFKEWIERLEGFNAQAGLYAEQRT